MKFSPCTIGYFIHEFSCKNRNQAESPSKYLTLEKVL